MLALNEQQNPAKGFDDLVLRAKKLLRPLSYGTSEVSALEGIIFSAPQDASAVAMAAESVNLLQTYILLYADSRPPADYNSATVSSKLSLAHRVLSGADSFPDLVLCNDALAKPTASIVAHLLSFFFSLSCASSSVTFDLSSLPLPRDPSPPLSLSSLSSSPSFPSPSFSTPPPSSSSSSSLSPPRLRHRPPSSSFSPSPAPRSLRAVSPDRPASPSLFKTPSVENMDLPYRMHTFSFSSSTASSTSSSLSSSFSPTPPLPTTTTTHSSSSSSSSASFTSSPSRPSIADPASPSPFLSLQQKPSPSPLAPSRDSLDALVRTQSERKPSPSRSKSLRSAFFFSRSKSPTSRSFDPSLASRSPKQNRSKSTGPSPASTLPGLLLPAASVDEDAFDRTHGSSPRFSFLSSSSSSSSSTSLHRFSPPSTPRSASLQRKTSRPCHGFDAPLHAAAHAALHLPAPPLPLSLAEDPPGFSTAASEISAHLWSPGDCDYAQLLTPRLLRALEGLRISPSFALAHWLEFLGVLALHARSLRDDESAEHLGVCWRLAHQDPHAVPDLALDVALPVSQPLHLTRLFYASPKMTVADAERVARPMGDSPAAEFWILRRESCSSSAKPGDALLAVLASLGPTEVLCYCTPESAMNMRTDCCAAFPSLSLAPDISVVNKRTASSALRRRTKTTILSYSSPWKYYDKKDASAADAPSVLVYHKKRNLPFRVYRHASANDFAQWCSTVCSLLATASLAAESPLIQPIHDIFLSKNQIYSAREGHHTGLSVILKDGKWSEDILLYIVKQLVAILEFLHQCRYVVGRLLLSSFVVTDSGAILFDDASRLISLSDLGSQRVRGINHASRDPLTPGFLHSLAPEVLKHHAYGTQADIFSLGMLAANLLMGPAGSSSSQDTFFHPTSENLLVSLLQHAFVSPFELFPSLSDPNVVKSFDEFFTSTLQMDPDARLSAEKLHQLSCFQKAAKPQQFRTTCIATQYMRFLNPRN